ncbi:hypothetical protein J3458_019371 [Metarhizium acridum]|uniref:uncharacterized protein n=1 Tax=Metarhizium acridum TaxID=92637 RepID=UPI001C6C6D99|nr:hypothetical protein J3458_019371 [Metarhizium acridum]
MGIVVVVRLPDADTSAVVVASHAILHCQVAGVFESRPFIYQVSQTYVIHYEVELVDVLMVEADVHADTVVASVWVPPELDVVAFAVLVAEVVQSTTEIENCQLRA